MATNRTIMNTTNQLLAQCILLERLLKSKADDLSDEIRKTDARLANVIRNELRAIERTHSYFYKTVQPVITTDILIDFEKLESIIDEFFNKIEK